MEDGMIERGEDERIGNKRGRDAKDNMGRLEKRPSGIVVSQEHNGEEMISGVKYEEEKKTGGGLFNQLIANLVNSPKSNHQGETDVFDAEFVEKNNGDPGGGRGGEGGGGSSGGVINNLISNIFHSGSGGGGGGDESEVVEKGGEEKKDEKVGGGNIIDSIVSQLPRTLSEDAAPATDEASILIHSIIHD